MKKLFILLLVLCLSLLFINTALGYEDEPHETEYYPYNYYPHSYYGPEPAYTSPEDFDHFATATIEDLYAYSMDSGIYHEVIPEEIPCFDPPSPTPIVAPPRYTSAAVVVMDADTGIVLYGSQHNTQLYPASITKIMTALIVLEHVQDLTERIEFSNNAVFSIPRNSSHIAMDVGETLTVYQALYGLMLSSANEVSIALAEHVAGTVEAFAELMNARAITLGAANTHFVNPSGLPDEGHVTTAYDMALIMREAVRHQVFVDIISTRRFDIPPTERQNYTRELLNTNRLIHPGSYFNEWVVGSKTGWTTPARHTLVTYAELDGRRLIISTLQAESGGNFRDTLALLSFGFSMPFEDRRVFESEAYIRKVPVYQNINDRPLHIGYVTLRAGHDLHFNLPIDFDIRDLRYDLDIPERLTPPIQVGDSLGRVAVYVQNIQAGEVELLAQNLVMELPVSDSYEGTGAGGGENLGVLAHAPGYSHSHYPNLAVYPSNSWSNLWSNEYLQDLALPLGIIIITLTISLFVIITGRRRRTQKLVSKRFAKYAKSYKYR
ncbi:MAG: D-alanyl-D-alanine carboxypeptidase [Defluviitaleaceae bacterium]|nr:D-alanyl-D-alanine carboxypeptidase [Defluviitaleaceae bacterium]